MNYEILSAFVFATVVLAFSPGPDNMYVLTQSLVNGKKYGLATVAGLISGCLIHTTLLAFGMATIIEQNEHLFFGIKLFGACYLLFLAYKVLKSDASLLLSNQAAPKKRVADLFKQGFVMNVLNPKVTIFFLAFFPGFLFSKTLNTVVQFYVLGVIFMVVSAFVFSGIAILSGSISGYVTRNQKTGVYLKWLQIIVFFSIAVFLLFADRSEKVFLVLLM